MVQVRSLRYGEFGVSRRIVAEGVILCGPLIYVPPVKGMCQRKVVEKTSSYIPVELSHCGPRCLLAQIRRLFHSAAEAACAV